MHLLACFLEVGGNKSTQKKPTENMQYAICYVDHRCQTQGEKYLQKNYFILLYTIFSHKTSNLQKALNMLILTVSIRPEMIKKCAMC